MYGVRTPRLREYATQSRFVRKYNTVMITDIRPYTDEDEVIIRTPFSLVVQYIISIPSDSILAQLDLCCPFAHLGRSIDLSVRELRTRNVTGRSGPSCSPTKK